MKRFATWLRPWMALVVLSSSFAGELQAGKGGGRKAKGGAPNPKLLECRAAILSAAEKGPGGDWLYQDDLFEIMEAKGLQQLFYGNVYPCPFCGLYNPHKNEDGKTCTCGSCRKRFDANDDFVHEAKDERGRVLVHVRSINYTDDGVPKQLEAPWICPTCRTTNDDHEDVCTKPGCGTTREQGSRKVVEFGEGRVVIGTTNVLDGYVVDKPEDAAESIQARDEMEAAARRAEMESRAARGDRSEPAVESPRTTPGWQNLTRKQIIGIGAAALVGAGAIWYGLQDPAPPVLPQPRSVVATVVEVYWEQNAKILRKEGDVWKEFKVYPSHGNHTSQPHLNPDIPKEYLTDTRQYQVVVEPYYSIITSTDKGPGVEWEVSRERYRNWKPGDKGELRIMDTGRPLELRRVLP